MFYTRPATQRHIIFRKGKQATAPDGRLYYFVLNNLTLCDAYIYTDNHASDADSVLTVNC